MKVIINKTGEVQNVSLGHALNYLLPKGLAVVATTLKLEQLKNKVKEEVKTVTSQLAENRQRAEQLDGKVVEIKAEAGKGDKLHGSVGKTEIAEALKVNKKEVILDKPIKKIGEYEVELKFGKTRAKVKVKVITK